MKRVLILTIALLFIASVAFSDFAVKGEAKYEFVVALPHDDPGNQAVENGDELKLELTSSTESMKGVVQIMVNADTDETVHVAWVRTILVTTNFLNALQVKEVPLSLKLEVATGLGEIKTSQPWKISHHELEAKEALAQKLLSYTWGYCFKVSLLDMVTLQVGQETDAGAAKSSTITSSTGGFLYSLPKTMVDLSVKVDFVSVAASIILQQVRASSDLTAGFSAGAMADLSGFVGITLKVGVAIANGNVLADSTGPTSGTDKGTNAYWFGAAVRAEVPIGDMSLKASVSANGRWSTPDSTPIQGVGVAAEFWFVKQFGVGLASMLALGPAYAADDGEDISSSIANVEVFFLMNFGATTAQIGYVYVPEDIREPAVGDVGPYVGGLEFGAEDNNNNYGGISVVVKTKM